MKDKRTVIFCASGTHAQEIAGRLPDTGVAAEAVSGEIKGSDRREVLARFEQGVTKVLCACDLLNEGWDCPATEVLFMARPTMSKVLYTQQLGRGMRLSPGKESLMVFDFVDNASQYNMPYSMHRLFRLKEYKPGALVLGTKQQKTAEQGLYDKGERPDALIDWPVDALDYELVDIFNWQEEAAGMISQMEFVRRVDVQTETIERYVRDGLLVPDLVVPMSEHRTFKYFKEETLRKYAEQYGWTLIDDSNRKDLFLDMVRQMDMSYSYKPVLLKAVLLFADDKGRVKLGDSRSNYRKSGPMGRCVATNYGEQGNACAKSNTPSNRAPGNAFGANRTSNATDNREEEVAGMRAESILEEADEQPSAPTPAPAAENQAEPAPEPPALPEPEIEAIGDNSADMVYVPGFGWIESQGPNQATCAEDMYENGNKIGIMG